MTLLKAKIECNEDIKIISTGTTTKNSILLMLQFDICVALTPKPDNVSALYLTNETLIIRFQVRVFVLYTIRLIISIDTSVLYE